LLNTPFPDFRGEHWTELVPPKTHSLVADIDAAFEQKILDLTQLQPIPDVHHHCQADHLRRTDEIAGWIFHPRGYGPPLPGSTRFSLTVPSDVISTDRHHGAAKT
jgi:hypothetical protein